MFIMWKDSSLRARQSWSCARWGGVAWHPPPPLPRSAAMAERGSGGGLGPAPASQPAKRTGGWAVRRALHRRARPGRQEPNQQEGSPLPGWAAQAVLDASPRGLSLLP